jgi:hypothetical protein
MREVVTTTKGVPRWLWALVLVQAVQAVTYGVRVASGEGGEAILLLVMTSLVAVCGVVVLLVDLRATLVLTEDTLLVERRWRPLRVPREAVLAVDGDVRGRPSWSGSAVLTVRGRDRPVRLGNVEMHARVLVPRLQEWAGVGDTVPSSEGSASPT